MSFTNASIRVFFVLLLALTGNLNAQINQEHDFTELYKTLNKDFAKDFEFSVLLECNDTIILAENFGYLNKNDTKPVDEKTLYNIASITKSFTAVGISKLVEQNKIYMTDKLDRFFDNVPKSMESISIRNLLSHKSGLTQTYPLDGISDSNQAIELIFSEELEFTPGSNFRYSNQNYQLLALIIEKVTETRFEDFIRMNILVPLKMKDTYFWDEVNDQQNIAPLNKRILRRIGKRNWGFIGATGMFTTTSDLSKFWKGIIKNEILSKESLDNIFKSYHETNSGIQVGLGFFISPNTQWKTAEYWTRGTESWGHNSVIRFFPEKKVTIIVSTNSGEIGKNKITGNKAISNLIADYLFK